MDTHLPAGVHNVEAFTDQFNEWMFKVVLECPLLNQVFKSS